ncbi:alpha/beta hydrolase [Natrialba swarupiae]|uniref:Alpha/beta hydrolase n=1 Tax=Natrialba swarupiae TaxID=2448032 RepID=A0A5D5AQE3_9EURY|nr:dienelactone hydrolase family protein [Natrialba swarupiae]MCW8173137.1 alpha/beta hydrolase [Natrialba swarupiae]TYT63223.1 alpha/beta hydrolase [Natrialba swarupiae]
MTDVLIPGGRDVRATLEEPATDTEAIVVACPPHPEHGGSRSDGRLVAVGDALRESGIACLRFDYGAWDDGYGEREDVRNAVRWVADRYDQVGVFGYSFGATQALLASADVDAVDAVSALAPAARLADDLEAVPALESLSIPVQILYGERDTTVEWEPVVERATDRTDEVTAIPADHFFVGQRQPIAADVRAFFERTLLE